MIVNACIIVISAALFVYWFRYTCRLILSTRTATDFSVPFAEANRLCFPEVQAKLSHAAADHLDAIRDSLRRDYRLLTYLFSHAGEDRIGDQAIERRLLMVDFRIMQVWYPFARRLSPSNARNALDEMAQIVSYFANSMGEHLSGASA